MNGVHDMGGMDGFGKVEPEANEPVFHARWEGRLMAMTRAMSTGLGHWNIDIGRYGIEVLPPHVYLSSSYYRRWYFRTANLAVQLGLIGADELEAGHALRAGGGKETKKFTAADVGRYGIEVLPPDVYLSSSYYRRWYFRTANLAVERGLIGADELEAGRALRTDGGKDRKKFSTTDVERVSRRGSFGRTPTAPARFGIGERVRAINTHPKSHTRLPRYARGHVGVIELVHGAHVFPDAFVAGKGEEPQWLYTVRFDSRELWGPDADPTVKISIDAFEPYLEHA